MHEVKKNNQKIKTDTKFLTLLKTSIQIAREQGFEP